MNREQLAAEAVQAGRNSKHNLKLIRKYPDRMLPGKTEDGMEYLNRMIRFAEEEKKNARRAGRTLGLRSRLMSLLSSILADSPKERKEGTV
ncbi:hypothetical protein J25TS5_15170 [Paenibacillus faecis]|uniref:hypothetical protein n=1 Tax=Paenibacillus faecis TaxID=862114 RepID=UPI001B090D42|nr:hypothetical protein [Paenibacillus faecis]GIO84585.1 hypothetical protein J25TS5_15170 [Paenibacillus faecis]